MTISIRCGVRSDERRRKRVSELTEGEIRMRIRPPAPIGHRPIKPPPAPQPKNEYRAGNIMESRTIRIEISDLDLYKLAMSKAGAEIRLYGEVIGFIPPPSIEFTGIAGGDGILVVKNNI